MYTEEFPVQGSALVPRVRFAPAPTGTMHLGNIRTALLNYLFAKKQGGIFIIRVEDTDQERVFDPGAQRIMSDLAWLGLSYQEGPGVGGNFGPYFQSERGQIYAAALEELIRNQKVYRCFCTEEELDKKRQRQQALKLPPRYDRTCLGLSQEESDALVVQKKPFIWRLALPQDRSVQIRDLAHGSITFHMKDFSDIPLTRSDGSFTFIFANGVDDIRMRMTHVIRGEDHLTNTASQVILYEALGAAIPVFWHLPIICNIQGKKLSKRDFGFSIDDLRDAGFLPEAICNYLGIIGGSFAQEILSLDELAAAMQFEGMHATGHMKYDVEKLRWVNHQWIMKCTPEDILKRAYQWLEKSFSDISVKDQSVLLTLIRLVQPELRTLGELPDHLRFYFKRPDVQTMTVDGRVVSIVQQAFQSGHDVETCLAQMKSMAQKAGIPTKELFSGVRIILTGSAHGLGIKDLITVLGMPEVQERIAVYLK